MRRIAAGKIRDAISELCIKANLFLREDVLKLLRLAYGKEKNFRAKEALRAIINNSLLAKEERLAICQDTGLPVVFLELGQAVMISGDLKKAINEGIEIGYRKGNLRNSIVDPLVREKPCSAPAVIHLEITRGEKIKLTVLPKGFGCENKTQLKMLRPTAKIAEAKQFIIDTVKAAGADACPPYIVGVGIGGTADYATLLAKKALLANVSAKRSTLNAKLESDLLSKINKLNIGPMGFGGRTTALAVNILTHPTHIAGLPVAVNISCHALRSASVTI